MIITHRKIGITLAALTIAGFSLQPSVEAKPLKIYILAGQSNMEGHAKVETFDYMGDDPATAPLLKEMRDKQGKPRVCQDVYISYLTGRGGWGKPMIGMSKKGKLTTGFGADGSKIGPEFTFGLTMEKKHDGPVLIIKTAWGGKSLHTDFRPPSAGPYKLNEWQLKNYPKQEGHGIPKDFAKWKVDKKAATGHYYRLMAEHVKKVLADIKQVHPDYDPKQGYELAGFVWFQGWNDMVASHEYPHPDKPGRYGLYSDLLAHFIRDVRKEFDAPKMPFVIGVMGVGGVQDKPNYFRQAMAAPAALPEFKGNVLAVETAPYWDEPLGKIEAKHGNVRQMGYFLRSKHKDHANKDGNMTKEQQQAYIKEFRAKLITPADEAMWKRGASNAGYHYLGCAKTMALIGQAFAEANLKQEKK
jgi:alpha-galactosidase